MVPAWGFGDVSMLLGILSALVIFQAGAEPAAPTSPIQAAAVGVAPPAPELKPGERKVKMICRTETTTGTRFSKRVCMSQEDMKQREEEARAGLAELQRFTPAPPPKR